MLWAKRLFFFRLSLAITAERKKMNNSYYGGCDPPIPWIGGKTSLLPIIKRIVPKDINRFADVFGGGGSVSLSKKYAPVQIYNDLDYGLFNFMHTLRDRSDELISRITGVFKADGSVNEDFPNIYYINSRRDFEIAYTIFNYSDDLVKMHGQYSKILNSAKTDEEKKGSVIMVTEMVRTLDARVKDVQLWDATFFYILTKGSFSATRESWAIKPINPDSVVNVLNRAAYGLRGLILENKDCFDLIDYVDDPMSAVYTDPPYVKAEALYTGVPLFNEELHKRLHDRLLKCKCRVLISYNDCPYVNDLYSEPVWDKIHTDRSHNMSMQTGEGKRYKEILIANYGINELYNFNRQTTLFDDYYPMKEKGRIILP